MDGALDPGPWSASVHAEPDQAFVATLAERLTRRVPRRAVSVTELVDLRSAYWRSVAPIEPTPERRAVLAAGREQHIRIGHLLAPARYREVRVQREGIVGQIDLLEDHPTELKTTGSTVPAGALRTMRAAYLEQLAMYCALVGVPEGRLVLIGTAEPSAPRVSVFRARVRSLDAVWGEMVRRASALRLALANHDPSGLPRCPWRSRGCEYEAAGACNCTGDEAMASSVLLDEVDDPVDDRDAASRLEARLGADAIGPPPAARRFADLVYPRRAFFSRTAPAEAEAAGAPRWTPSNSPEELYRVLVDLLEAGPSGEFTREPPRDGEPLETVACVRGDPVLLKVTRAWRPSSAAELLVGQPQYFLELGLRCAAVDRPNGWLVLGYERAETWSEKVIAFRVGFEPFSVLQSMFEARRKALSEAVITGSPGALPACPAWMVDGCDYRSRCGCAGAGATGRENR